MPRVTWALFALFFASILSSCGGGSATSPLQSLKINQQSVVFPTFAATGVYSNGKQVTPVAVSWVAWSFGSFITGTPHYLLSSAPYPPSCGSQCSGWTLVAIAPADPSAPKNGSIPTAVFQDLVTGKAATEAGFVAATIQL